MKLTTVIASVNNNPEYYKFIPKQILFWGKFGIKFIALFVGNKIPHELKPYSLNIILWSHNLDLNTAFVGQNLRIYYTALLNLPDDEMVMITDMDMLPAKPDYYVNDLEYYNKEDFIYYRHIDEIQIYMCYNAAHPETWGKLFQITSEEDVINAINNTYQQSYNGIPGSHGWCIDQCVMYNVLHNYEHLQVLNRPIHRLERHMCEHYIRKNDKNYMDKFDDMHFHRSFMNNAHLIADVERQLEEKYP